ncbi:hypothetical protein EUGRSUZ_E03414 [Eucalyptus grandis]|uniref:Uncharacterized protein n=2 Tax=Eucalyptus grandis TaxID=71139 RepID=A0ACC3KYZ5_EUCGR|nr:hypothetical protein EUGRSUZ_E03414 [Eucalyptus grandis]
MRQQLLPSMSKDIEAVLKLLNDSASESCLSIFRVPQALAGGIAKACLPRIVSIGSYHHGESATQRALKIQWIDLVKMMVLDGCFIIEFLHQIARYVPSDKILLINSNSFVLLSLGRDLLRLENQIPYFVLEDFSIPTYQQDNPVDESSSYHLIKSASEFRRLGIRFKRSEASTFLEIIFDSRCKTIGIPKIKIDHDLNCILLNMVAFEQCRGQVDGHITAYAMFMECLIHIANDVQLLHDHKVISNHGMSNEDVARFFGDLCKDVYFDLLNAFHENPWLALSGLAIVTLVGLIQTVYTVLQYYHPK